MKHWNELRDTLCRELDEIAEKGELSAGDLETVDKLTHTLKNLDKIMMGGEYSNAGDWYAMGNYGRDGVSYRGRKRDSMGRYSRADAREDMAEKLRRMMDDAPDSRTREALEKALRCMED
jgi:hypothetical protein